MPSCCEELPTQQSALRVACFCHFDRGAASRCRDYTDISIAVATPKGLVVPVLRNVDELDFAGVEKVRPAARPGLQAALFALWHCFVLNSHGGHHSAGVGSTLPAAAADWGPSSWLKALWHCCCFGGGVHHTPSSYSLPHGVLSMANKVA